MALEGSFVAGFAFLRSFGQQRERETDGQTALFLSLCCMRWCFNKEQVYEREAARSRLSTPHGRVEVFSEPTALSQSDLEGGKLYLVREFRASIAPLLVVVGSRLLCCHFHQRHVMLCWGDVRASRL